MQTFNKRQKLILMSFKFFRIFFKGSRYQHTRIATSIYLTLISKIVPSSSDLKVLFRGSEFITQNMDVTLLPSMMDGSFETSELDWILDFLREKENFLFVDIGANIGIYSVLIAKQSKTRCIAIEPDPRNLKRLQINIDHNGLSDRILVLPLAVGIPADSAIPKAERTFYLSKFGATSRLLNTDELVLDQESVSVRVKTLDEILQENELWQSGEILIKIDVEGFEPEVIASGIQTIRDTRPWLLVEFSMDRDRNELAKWDSGLLSELFSIYPKIQVFKKGQMVNCANPQAILNISPFEVVNILFSP
jgi:FkbM family methyltransferase